MKISTPGEPVFNPDTGQYDPGPDITLYEGPGVIYPSSSGPGMVLSLEGQPYSNDTPSKYKLLTPLSAPVASRNQHVSLTAADPNAIGRIWIVTDLGETSSLPVLRITWLDQQTQITGS